jgi:hypothetical protein
VPRSSLMLALLVASSSTLAAQAAPAAKAATKPAATRPVWPDEGPRTWTVRKTETAITANDLRTRLYQFADDSMEGRRIGERGNVKGTDYIASEFKRLGLKPAGDNGTYFQTLAFGPSAFSVAASQLSVAGAAATVKIDWVPMTPASGVGAKVDISNVPVVYAGRWDDSAPLDPAMFRGKVVVFSGGPGATVAGRGAATLARCDSLPNRFGARNAAYADSVAAAARAAAGGRGGAPAGGRGGAGGASRFGPLGAVAVLFVNLENLAPASVNGVFDGRMGMQPTSPAAGPGGATISQALATRLFGKPLDQVAVGTAGQPVSASWSYDWKISPFPARNVVAILPGSDPARADEYVLVGAHNDHVGMNPVGVDHDSLRAVNWVTRPQGNNDPSCRPTPEQQHRIDSLIARARSIRPIRRDSIMNGADDDGSGTVALLEIAEKFASEKPARSIIFVSHEGEEGGLLGSRWFVDHSPIPLDKIAAAHNMDMEGKGRVEYVRFGGPTSIQMLGSRRLSKDFGDIIDSVNAVRPEVMAIDKSWDVFENPMNRFCRSDQVNYVTKNVPVTYFSTGYAPDYHQPTDEPQYIEYDHMARVARFVHDIMWAVAQRKDRPAINGNDPRYPSCAR